MGSLEPILRILVRDTTFLNVVVINPDFFLYGDAFVTEKIIDFAEESVRGNKKEIEKGNLTMLSRQYVSGPS